jgi:GTPase SAR1 family protein
VPQLLLATPEFAAAAWAVLDGEVEDKRVKVILVGDSGAGKTQIRRRLGGREFEGEHKSTDTAEVTSVEVTSVTETTRPSGAGTSATIARARPLRLQGCRSRLTKEKFGFVGRVERRTCCAGRSTSRSSTTARRCRCGTLAGRPSTLWCTTCF